MRSLAISSVAVAALMVAQPALAEIDSAVGAPPVAPPTTMGHPDNHIQMPTPVPMKRMQPAVSYARPGYGFQLPREWMSPQYIVDGRDFGLGRPAPGFGWSRYYDNMVLTDQWGRVYDVAEPDDRGGFERGSYDRDGRRFGSRSTDGIAGGVAGAAVGAVAGNLIAGHGSRLAGSLIGGGVGALVGLGVEALILKKGRKQSHGADYDEGHYGRGGHSHWGGAPAYGYGYSYGGAYAGGSEVVTTTTTTTHGGGGGYLVPRQVVTYENVYAPVRTKYRVREAAPTKYRVREEAPVTTGKIRERTKLHTRTY